MSEKTSVVVPTIRGDRIDDWLKKWKSLLSDTQIIIVEDNPEKTFNVSEKNVTHLYLARYR